MLAGIKIPSIPRELQDYNTALYKYLITIAGKVFVSYEKALDIFRQVHATQ